VNSTKITSRVTGQFGSGLPITRRSGPIECTTCATIPGHLSGGSAIRMRLDETVTSTELLLDQYRSIVERNGKTKFSSSRKRSARLNFYSHSGRRKPETISWRRSHRRQLYLVRQ